ncbi:MFS transporter [Pseudomonas sp. TCU-HL1]|uniref:MFS transporter n=1 Tax=Pseudomonas sp. TCU-HL1 TaxID=1856685 RepID=UPI00083D7BF3|nr:MFS transporter [Pseudomonas sp. TCU-HL1]AOE86171.1 permease [Pseudomonas sp. TCU-HL1]
MQEATLAQPASRQAWLGLFTVLGLVALVAMDGSVLYLAMPHITSAITPTADQALWILDIYGFVVGSLLVAFGNIGDRFGRLRLVMVGACVFGAASVGAAFSESPTSLIAFRALTGLGGATLLPSGLAIVSNLFPDPKQRAQAIGIFAATFAAGFAVGPLIGGMLLQHYTWGSVFLINVPVVVLFLLLAPQLLKEVHAPTEGKIDLLSLLLSFVGILLFTYSLKTGAVLGVSTEQLAIGAAGLLGLIWFTLRQRNLEHPLLDVRLFKDRIFTIAILTGLLSLVVWSSAGYLAGVYMQSVLGFDVFSTALLTIPGALVLTATCVWTSHIVDRVGRKWALVTTHLLIAAGMGLLLLTTATHGAAFFVASTIVAGVGYGLSFSLVAEIAVSAVPPERAGAAASIAETSNEIGNALGISVLGSVAALWFRLYGPGVAGTLNETLDQTLISPETIQHANDAFLAGMHTALGIAGLLTFIVAVLAIVWLPRKMPE